MDIFNFKVKQIIHFDPLLQGTIDQIKLFSPLHYIQSDLDYPATLITTADHDDRVFPAHSYKYAATMQEKYRGGNPILLRIETKTGHGAAKTTSTISRYADSWAFLLYQMGIKPGMGSSR